MRAAAGIALMTAGLALGNIGSAGAHHSHAMFDMTKDVSITGTVTNYSYRNPHVFLYLDVPGDNGEVVFWAVEMSSIGNTQRRGIYRSTFQVAIS